VRYRASSNFIRSYDSYSLRVWGRVYTGVSGSQGWTSLTMTGLHGEVSW
jgi:hypothetical protein